MQHGQKKDKFFLPFSLRHFLFSVSVGGGMLLTDLGPLCGPYIVSSHGVGGHIRQVLGD